MTKILSVLERPYFDFLVLPRGACWDSRGRLRKECFHKPDSLLIHESTVIAFLSAFADSHPRFDGYGPTEYFGENLNVLWTSLETQVQTISSCEDISRFMEMLASDTIRDYDRVLGNWPPQWEAIRDELVEQGRKVLDRAKQAQQEEKALLVLGI